MIRFVHIINPVKLSEKSELSIAQPITFQSMLTAKRFTETNVQIVTTQFEEDKTIIPEGFRQLSNLTRSVLDVNAKLSQRKLPLIHDILQKLKETDGDYYIFTNVDIALMPFFYESVRQITGLGHDAVIINRRRLKNTYSKIEELPLMYADPGKSHPGFDCFIFHKSLLDKLILDNICVGISFLEVSLIHNLLAFAEKPLYVPDAHLTFHIGMEVLVPRKQNPFYWHNRTVYFEKIEPRLKSHFDIRKFPYSNESSVKRALKHTLNPALFTKNYFRMEGRNLKRSLKEKLDELRWNFLQR
ncbi:MAG: hypothetical protein J0G96_09730 [Flavobacteriia bacterium]|nr:hypothetical protein [Flavobacteriia bacterium]